MNEQHITGYYVRVQRDGRWRAVDIATLSDEELQAFFVESDAAQARKWAIGLAQWIRDHVVVRGEPEL